MKRKKISFGYLEKTNDDYDDKKHHIIWMGNMIIIMRGEKVEKTDIDNDDIQKQTNFEKKIYHQKIEMNWNGMAEMNHLNRCLHTHISRKKFIRKNYFQKKIILQIINGEDCQE